MQPTARPSRSLNDAIALRDRNWPLRQVGEQLRLMPGRGSQHDHIRGPPLTACVNRPLRPAPRQPINTDTGSYHITQLRRKRVDQHLQPFAE